MSAEVVEFGDCKVELQPELLAFAEENLSDYLMTEAGYYDNLGKYLALAEAHYQNAENYVERLTAASFILAKNDGGTEKTCEAKAKSDPAVIEAKAEVVKARYAVMRLRNHLRAWDKNHENAQSIGHTLRKQLDVTSQDRVMYPAGHSGEPLGFSRRHDDEVALTIKELGVEGLI